jgi:hypothetical protein
VPTLLENRHFQQNKEKKRDPIEKKTVVATAAALGIALLFYTQGARAANPASDSGSLYLKPWGPVNPQNQASTGFAPWIFDQYNTPISPFLIDTVKGAWVIQVPADNNGTTAYDAAWRSFTGDGALDPGQTFSTAVLFTPPGPYSTTELPTEGIDFFAQDPAVPSSYYTFGHQVLGIYFATNSPSGPHFTLAVHNTLSDEQANIYVAIPLAFTGTLNKPQLVQIHLTQHAQGNWVLKMVSGNGAVVLTSHEYGATWNTVIGLDAVRYFTSQGGTTPGGPLEWKHMSVR